MIKQSSTTSSAIIYVLQAVFSHHGIPDVVRSDNGPQYASQEFAQFARAYGFAMSVAAQSFPKQWSGGTECSNSEAVIEAKLRPIQVSPEL